MKEYDIFIKRLTFFHNIMKHETFPWYQYILYILICEYLLLLLLRLFTLPQARTYTPRNLQPKCLWVSCL